MWYGKNQYNPVKIHTQFHTLNSSMAKLTATKCDTAKPNPHKDLIYSDDNCLKFRIRPSGNKTWRIDYTFKGERKSPTIGVYSKHATISTSNVNELLKHGQLTLSQARTIAKHWKDRRNAGHDPYAEWQLSLAEENEAMAIRQAVIEAESSLPTVNQVIDLFMQKIMNGKKSANNIHYRLSRLAYYIGEKKIRDISNNDIFIALDDIALGSREGKSAKQLAGEVLTQAKRVWKFAKARGFIEESCIAELTRADIDARPRKREVVLRIDEIVKLWRAISVGDQCKSDPVTIAALKLLILTGQRECEVCEARWSEMDLEKSVWNIPAERTKVKRVHLVHLAPLAVNTLKSLQYITGSSDFVFQSPLKPGQPIYGRSVYNALSTLFKRGLLKSITKCNVHDLRRTLITRLPDLGFDPFIGNKIANHVLPGVLGHYNHNSHEKDRKQALYRWAQLFEVDGSDVA
jgi:integrase